MEFLLYAPLYLFLGFLGALGYNLDLDGEADLVELGAIVIFWPIFAILAIPGRFIRFVTKSIQESLKTGS